MADLPRTLGLPDFPWDLLVPAKELAASHPGGICDLSVGTPVDPTPAFVRAALDEASDAPGYPTVIGTEEVRHAILEWAARRGMVDVGTDGAIPTIGSKEAVAWLPTLLGVRPGDTVLVPEVAYPTYDVGARLAGATPVPVDPTRPDSWPDAALVWLNSPGNPDGHVLTRDQLRSALRWARSHGAVLASDECYAALPWGAPFVDEGVPSLLDREVCEGDPRGVLVLYSLSKQSNMAGYRAAVLVGDPDLVRPVVEVRKHSGMMVPAPVQHAMAVALLDPEHADAQRRTYARRRELLLAAVDAAGLENDPDSVAGLYLWVRDPSATSPDSWALVDRLARLGILVAPGDFYGEAGRGRVRIALTATDERIAAAAARLSAAAQES
ncbi:succinyldiaminopimelate transaminase [Actinomyces polynesiensis]|uniref:succinyldiaminopimelate transaminase n=1 Tax=Actinomyces polynesiensis TaxID=1325934 RepID=UPI0005BE1118|nr:succinyldiaminopimelate transaminase [Actinomyces polynesiensis]